VKKSLLFLITLSLILILAGTASAETRDRKVNLVIGQSQAQINDQSVTMSAPAQVVEGRTLVPLRFIGEAFGCDVQWNNDSRTATVIFVDQTIEVPIGQSYAVINGEKTAVQVPAQIINGSTYVPLRFISENLGAKVDYNMTTSAISISIKKYLSKDQSFEMVIPADWVIDEETTEIVRISSPGASQIIVGLADKGDGINKSNFNIFAEGCFKEFASKDEVVTFVKDVSAVLAYKEDGFVNIIAYKLLDDGIYCCTLTAAKTSSEGSLLVGQFEIVLNSLKTPVI